MREEKLVFFILLSSLLVLFISACMPRGKSDKVTVGKDTYVCIYLGPLDWGTGGQYYRLATTVKADQFSRIRVPNSWTSKTYWNDTLLGSLSIYDQETPGVGLAVTVGSMNVLSYQRIYREVAYKHETSAPTSAPTLSPTISPTASPSVSMSPTFSPTPAHTDSSTQAPSAGGSVRRLSTDSTSEIPLDPPTNAPALSPANSLFVEAMNMFSIPSLMSDSAVNSSAVHSITFPVLMAIITVEKGTVKSIVWDNQCSWCSNNHCKANTVNFDNQPVNTKGENCFVEDSECEETLSDNIFTTNKLCELTVYITWHGTDSAGVNFESSAERFSRFSSTQVKNMTSTWKDEKVNASKKSDISPLKLEGVLELRRLRMPTTQVAGKASQHNC
eukprot:gene767-832_t